jgi:acid phosphatase
MRNRPDRQALIFKLMCALILLGLIHMSCVICDQSDNTPCTPAAPSPSSPPVGLQVKHVFIVIEENHGFSKVIGNPNMPYLNSLATIYAFAEGYHANTHPSIGNYFMLTTGQIITNDDGFSGTVTDDNIVRHLTEAGKTWKEYSEGLPSVGFTGGDSDGYIEHHNPLSYFSDVRNDPREANNLVPFSQLAADLAGRTLPDYSFIVPDNNHNAHDCPSGGSSCSDNEKLAAADNWLKSNIDPLVRSTDFATPGGGLLIITFDESAKCDRSQGGGRVAWVIVGPNVKRGFTSTTCFQHQSTLRLMSEAIGLTSFPGAGASAPDMREFISGN